MKHVRLIPVDKKQRDQEWILELHDEKVVLIDDENYIAAEFPFEETLNRLLLPGFSNQNVQAITVVGEYGRLYQFQNKGDAKGKIKQYLRQATVEAGGVQKFLWQGLGLIAGGFVALVLMCGLIVGTGTIYFWLPIIGIVCICVGVYKLYEYTQMSGMSRRGERDEYDEE